MGGYVTMLMPQKKSINESYKKLQENLKYFSKYFFTFLWHNLDNKVLFKKSFNEPCCIKTKKLTSVV